MRTHRRTRTCRPARLITAAILGLAVSLTAASCGSQDSDTPPEVSATEHDDADVTFATQMTQHHAQALLMADMTRNRPLDPEVEQLVEDIRAAQGPEIETFTDWLTAWGEEVPATVRDHAGAGHGGSEGSHSMASSRGMDRDESGMQTAGALAALENAPDSDFQTRWLQMMIAHHNGAVEMAQTEREQGRYESAVDLAGTIITTQSAEIEQMQLILDS